MLQQTQVKTVLAYWERWMRRFPTIQSLAKAKPDEVLKLWEGLGYYTRARNLQKTAKILVEQHNGKFPEGFSEILALPGIGRYTAGAISSIAFNQAAPILDGNVIRVLTRLFGIKGDPGGTSTNARLWALAEGLVRLASKAGVAGDRQCSSFNQALMELGALVCTPAQPKCPLCPIIAQCVAQRTGQVKSLPNLRRRMPSTARRFVAVVAESRGRFLVRQRPVGGINAQFWEFPNIELTPNSPPLNETARTILNVTPIVLRPLCVIKHTITRYRITLDAYHASVKRSPRRTVDGGHWLTWDELQPLPFTSAHRKILKVMAPMRAR